MALFRRRKADQSALPEVDKYYDGERRDRAGLAWLLAFASVAIAALIFIGLFYAGRWAYREITEDDNEVAVTQNEGESDAPSFDGGSQEDQNSSGSNESNTDGDSGTSGSQNGDENSESEDQSGSSSDDSNSSQEQSGDQEVSGGSDSSNGASNNSSDVPATGDNPGDLPHTGPAGVLALATTVSVVAGAGHFAANRKRR